MVQSAWQQRAMAYTYAVVWTPLTLDGPIMLRSNLFTRNKKIVRGELTFKNPFGDFTVFDNFFLENHKYGVFGLKPEFNFEFSQQDFFDFLTNEGKGIEVTGDEIDYDEIWTFDDMEQGNVLTIGSSRRAIVRSFGIVKHDEDLHFFATLGVEKTAFLVVVDGGENQFKYGPDVYRQADHFDGDPDYWRVILSGTFSLKEKTFAKRYMSLSISGGRKAIRILDCSDIEFFMGRKFESPEEELKAVEECLERWEEFSDLFSIMYEFLKLPEYSKFMLTKTSVTKQKITLPKPPAGNPYFQQVFSKAKKNKRLTTVRVRSLRYDTPPTRQRKPQMRFKTIKWQMQVRGFWRSLQNSSTIGKDQKGEYTQPGRTWVKSHVRHRDLPRRDVVFQKLKVSDARKKIQTSDAATP